MRGTLLAAAVLAALWAASLGGAYHKGRSDAAARAEARAAQGYRDTRERIDDALDMAPADDDDLRRRLRALAR
ncbi:hypothetical protein [Pseudoroseicyclus aestuarii]|uniref:Uncharacterized protein n=1 Tax=Pseudoroseicyclus aestuarii TaxID=1795041 RepID=A0A318STS9_9RHOB|nr:hypothetical protein [Pseudoroseicyclus aestuarii]PYE83779.1 hypothetical protein DFP88_103139 [Pseudoroseicyclus aestuarii]